MANMYVHETYAATWAHMCTWAKEQLETTLHWEGRRSTFLRHDPQLACCKRVAAAGHVSVIV